MAAFNFECNGLVGSPALTKIDLSEHLGDESATRFGHVNKHKILGDNHNYSSCSPVNRQTVDSVIRE